MTVLSKSSLNTYITCPMLFKFTYVDKIKPECLSPQAQRGIDFHQFACDFYDNIHISGNIMQIDQKWLQEQKTVMTEDVLPFVTNFIEMEQDRWNLCVSKFPECPEKYYMPVLKEKKILNLGLEIVGIIDRVDLNFDGKTYTICDYKTEKFDMRSWKVTEHRREAAFYKYLLENSGLIDGEVTDFAFIYPRSNDVWAEKFGSRTINAFFKKLTDVREKIKREEFPCKVSIFCRYCDCNGMCPMETY